MDSTKKKSLQQYNSRAFDHVVKHYAIMVQLDPLCSSDIDPSHHPGKKRPSTIEYCADVEAATRHALRDDPAQYDLWCQIVRLRDSLEPDYPIGVQQANTVIQPCGREYRRRKLDNVVRYFSPFHAKKKRRGHV